MTDEITSSSFTAADQDEDNTVAGQVNVNVPDTSQERGAGDEQPQRGGSSKKSSGNEDPKTNSREKTSKDNDDEKAKSDVRDYIISTKRDTDELLKDLQILCQLKAQKHIIEARWFERRCQVLDKVAKILGFVSVTTVVIKWFASSADSKTAALSSEIGLLGFAGVLGAGVLQFLGKGSASLVPSFQKRADEHREVCFDWYCLKHDIKASRIELRNPIINTTQLLSDYRSLTREVKELSQELLVSRETSEQLKSLGDAKTIKQHEEKFLSNWPHDLFVPQTQRENYWEERL